jgi:hypothetical protein
MNSTKQQEIAEPQPEDFISAGEWREQHAGALFATQAALAWFLKSNVDELVRTGTVIRGRGRRPTLVHRKRFGPAVVEIISRGQAKEADRSARS